MLSSSLKPSSSNGGIAVFQATSASNMIATSANVGDMCIRSDLGTTFVCIGSPSSEIANWKFVTTLYDIAGSVVGKPSDGAVLTRFVVPRPMTLPANFANSVISSSTASSTISVVVLKKNGIQFGQITWAASGTVPTTMSVATEFNVGDVLTIEQQGAADATLADIQYTFVATLK